MIKIYVDTEEEKEQLLKESEYIHDFAKIVKNKKGETEVIGLDSDNAGILMHIYTNPDSIIVSKNWRYTNLFK